MDLDDLLKQIKKSPEPAVKEPTPTKPSKPAPAKPQPIEDVTKISPQMQKRINDFFKSDHQVEEAPVKVKAMFDKKAFVFIPFGTILDKKKVDAITERIRRRGGMTFRVDFFDWKKPSFVELFIIVSKDMPYQEFMNSIPETIRGMLDRFVFVDWKWISDCLQQNDLLDSKPYHVNWKKIAEAEEFAKREQIKKEEEARKRELEAQLIVELEPEPIQHQQQQFEEESLRKSPGREEKREEIEMLKKEEEVVPKRKMRVRENEVIMNAFRHLYDYRFGIEDEGEGEMEVENNEGGTLVHQETEKIVYDDEEDQEEEFKNLMKQVATQPQEEEKEPSETAMEIEDKLPPKKESKANVFDLMMKAQRSPQPRSPTSSRGLLLGERSPVSLDHDSQGKKDLVADPAPQANLNKHLTDEFERLLQAYVNDRDKGRMHAYRKALAAIRGLPYRVEDADQVKNVSGIGDKIRKKINEILTTGKLKKADEVSAGEKQEAMNILTKVWGVGVQTANSLYERNIKTIEELRKYQFLLNDNQRIGLKYFEEFEQRIPRDDITEMAKIIEEKIEEITGKPGLYKVICCGSYRRGRATCGDIDVLMTKTDGTSFEGFLARVVRGLEKVLLTDHLTKAKMSAMGSETYMGVALYKGIHRRIDMKVYPREQFGYAVLYFTGSDYFNRSIRLFALKKGWSLSDHGLSRVTKTNKGTETTLENIPCETEEQVFDVLGLKYRRPEERDV